jgi:DHA1 family tetracycline resistance protein-like MFS transporter
VDRVLNVVHFALCCLLFINAMSIGLVFPIFALLFFESGSSFLGGTDLHVKTLTYSMILALPNICMIFGAPFLGRMSDHTGRKFVLILGLLGVACSFFLSSVAISYGSLFLLFISRALAGFMDGSEAVAQAAIADFSHASEKARHMAYATFAGTIGFIIGPVLGGILAEPKITGQYHFQIPFIASSVLTLLNALFLHLSFPKKPPSHDDPQKISYLTLLVKGFMIAFDQRIRRFSLLLFILQGSLAAFAQICTIFLAQQFDYSSGEVGLFTTFLGACFSGGIFFAIYVLLKRFNHVHLLRWGIGLTILAFLTALQMHSSVLFPWISVIPLMLGIAMMYNVLLSFVSNAVSDREQGDAMGSGTALKALGWLVSSLFVAWLYPNVIALLLLLLVAALIALFSAMKIRAT